MYEHIRPARTVAPLPVSSANLLAALVQVPDPRRVVSVVSPLASLLTLTMRGLLANQPSLLAIAEWEARQSAVVLAPLGLAAGQTPCQATLQRLLVKLDGAALSRALTQNASPPRARGSQDIAIDGKAQGGRVQ